MNRVAKGRDDVVAHSAWPALFGLNTLEPSIMSFAEAITGRLFFGTTRTEKDT